MRRLLIFLLLAATIAFGQSQNWPVAAPISTNAQTGTTYTIANTDFAKLVTFSNAGAVAVTLPQAGTVGLNNGWFVYVQNVGVGTVTITPTTSTIDGAASLALTTNQGTILISNGTNYATVRGIGASSPFTGTFISGSANPSTTGILRLASSDGIGWRNNANGVDILLGKTGAAAAPFAADILDVSGFGGLKLPGTSGYGFSLNTPGLDIIATGIKQIYWQTGLWRMDSGFNPCWASGAPDLTACDTGTSRVSAGVVGVGTGAQGSTAGSLQLTNITALGTTTLGSAGQLVINTSGLLTTYNTLAVVGNGLASVQAAPAVITIGSGSSIAATSLCSTTLCPAGDYDVAAFLDITTACTTTGAYIVWLGWTDDAGAKTGSSTTTFIPINGLGVTQSTGSLALASTANYGQGHHYIHTTGAATGALGSINYGTTATACGTGGPMVGKMYLTVTRLR